MNFVERDSVPHVDKEHGTSIWYYIFPEHEIHYNEMQPKTTQPWHHHVKTDESIFIIKGRLRISWLEHEKQYNKDLDPGTVIRIEDSVHTVSNPTDDTSTFIVFKFVPRGENLHDLIKNDKVLDQLFDI